MKLKYLFVTLLLTLFFPLTASAEEAFDISNFNTDITIHENGILTVVETIDVNFLYERHGIFRDIQTNGITIDILSVTNENEQNRRFEIIGFDEGLRLKIGNPNKYVNGKQIYKITYTVKKAIRPFPEYNELYWNATGNAWPVKIHKASATVKLPSSVKSDMEVMMKCYTGVSSSTDQNCKSKYDSTSKTVTFNSTSDLAKYNGMTILVGIPPDTLIQPAVLEIKSVPSEANIKIDREEYCVTPCHLDMLSEGEYEISADRFGYKSPESKTVLLDNGSLVIESFNLKKHYWFDFLWFLGILIIALISIEPIITFWKKGRDPKGKGSIMPIYEPPDNLSPAEIGTLVDEKVHIRDLTATIVDLAVRGYLTIKVLPDAKGFIFKKDDYELIKTQNIKHEARNLKLKRRKELTEFEEKFMKKIFSSDNRKKVSDLEDKFYTHLTMLKQSLHKSLIDKKYFLKSAKVVRTTYLIKGIIVIIIGFMLASFHTGSVQTGISAVLIINGFLSLIFYKFMPQKTKKGALTKEQILGFKHYMKVAEEGRLKFQEKENIFYELLPYAMTMKVADKWAKAFKNIFKEPPEWYQGAGTGHFYPIAFTNNIQNMASSISTAFASQPSSSSGGSGSSGFSGGFSGGGFGGGGGGSW